MIDTPKATGFEAEIKAVQDYYAEGRPLAERLAWEHERLQEARAAFHAAAVSYQDWEQRYDAYQDWEQRYDATTDHPVSKLVRAIQASVDFVPAPLELY